MGGKPFCWTTYSEGEKKRGRGGKPPPPLPSARTKKKTPLFFFRTYIYLFNPGGEGELENFKTEFQLPSSSLTYTNNTLYIYYLIAGPFLDKDKKKKKNIVSVCMRESFIYTMRLLPRLPGKGGRVRPKESLSFQLAKIRLGEGGRGRGNS